MPRRRGVSVPEAIAEYQAHQETLGLARTTIRHQATCIGRLERACADEAHARGKRVPLGPGEIDSRVLARYFSNSTGKPGNMNNHLVPLRKFLQWCELNGLLDYGDMERIVSGRKFKDPVRAPKHYMPPEHFQIALEVAGERHPADRMAMALALYTLGRVSEIAAVRLRDLDFDAGEVNLWREKTDRWTPVGICPELREELGNWLRWYANNTSSLAYTMTQDHPDWLLVPRLEPVHGRGEGGHYTPVEQYLMEPGNTMRHMERIVKRVLDITGAKTIDGKTVRHVGEGMHTIRRGGARAMLKHQSEGLGFDRALLRVSVMLDHKDTRQTLRYIGMDQEREELNAWLRTSSPYGNTGNATSNVISLHGRRQEREEAWRA